MNFVSAKTVKEKFQITNQTLYNWRNNNLIQYKKINSKHFVYDLGSVLNEIETENRINVIYSRVSNTKQKDDLNLIDYSNY